MSLFGYLTLSQLTLYMLIEHLLWTMFCVLLLDIVFLLWMSMSASLLCNLGYQIALGCFDTLGLVKALISAHVLSFFVSLLFAWILHQRDKGKELIIGGN